MPPIIGKLKGINDDLEIEWSISDFFSLTKEKDVRYNSPVFNLADTSWYLQIFPNGHTTKNTVGEANCFLVKADAGQPVTVSYEFGVKKRNGNIEGKCTSRQMFDKKDFGYGCYHKISISKLLAEKLDLAPSDVVTILCKVKYSEPNIISSSDFQRTVKLKNDLKDLMLNGNGSDLTVKVGETEFRLHTVILGIRSPAFATMIKKEMDKNMEDTVHINDCDEVVFSMFLEYVYSGMVNDDTLKENAIGLYKLSEDYEVTELKEECIKTIKDTLSIAMFFDVIELAEKYDVEELKPLISKYCCDNLKNIVKDPKWLTLMEANTKKAYELLSMALESYVKS